MPTNLMICEICGKKYINRDYFKRHMENDHKSTPVVETPVVAEIPTTITLHFADPVEVTINGIHYSGKEMKVANMEIASEIVRIAKEAYGEHILL